MNVTVPLTKSIILEKHQDKIVKKIENPEEREKQTQEFLRQEKRLICK